MNYDLTGGDPKKPMPIMDNYSRNDSGLGPDAKNQGVTQENIRQDVNGSTNKPYPQERNFNMNMAATQPSGMGDYVTQKDHGNVANYFGQIKYARREGATSIYKDETRNTANDNAASKKAEGSSIFEPENENEESQDA